MAERELRVGGLVPWSSVDFPGRLAAVVFVQGCAWRCGYCHNPHLQRRARASDPSWARVRELLARRRGLLDAVVFSGGEPTADPALDAAAHEVAAAGYAVGLHSAGTHPERLARLLPRVDWVGLDVKAPFERYEAVTGAASSGSRARASCAAVLALARDYELRTTWHPALFPEEELVALAESLAGMGARRYAVQQFRRQGCAQARLRPSRSPSRETLQRIGALFETFTFRPA